VTSIAEQGVQELGGPSSILTRQKQDHIKLDVLLEELQRCSGLERQAVLNRVCRLVFPHAFAEEAVLWPVLRRVVEDGEQLTLEVEEEHQEINELTSRLETLDQADTAHPMLVQRLVELLREDVRDEEDVLLPRLQRLLDDRALRRLGRQWEGVRRIAPTRAHPTVARRPPGNVLAALPLTVLDRRRDRLDSAARRADGSVATALSGASRGAARVAERVERLRLMRTGERPQTQLRDEKERA
jgi:hemerythrin-like domain-containing protein